MKVLWFNNIVIPQIARAVGVPEVPVGGWMVKLADEVSQSDKIELTVAFPLAEDKDIEGRIDRISYISFYNGNKKKQKDRIRQIIEKNSPDVIHVFGTEYEHSYIVAEICQMLGISHRVVISIQGLISVYARHYTAFLNERVIKGKTFRDIVKGNISQKKKRMEKYGELEVAAIKNVGHIIGRTDWDKACVERINPNAHYHFNNEMLRNSFYNAPGWDYKTCEKRTIFISQATMPIKGLHLALEAIAGLYEDYPDLKVYIAGKSYYEKKRWKLSNYEKYIIKFIERNNLKDTIFFTGFLSEKEMCKQYLRANVFVLSSSIENSPNSLCEAMMLGTPVISSMVGGISNLVEHGVTGFLYQADAPYMLEYYIRKLFENPDCAMKISGKARKTAIKRHNTEKIVTDLFDIYQKIIENDSSLKND